MGDKSTGKEGRREEGRNEMRCAVVFFFYFRLHLLYKYEQSIVSRICTTGEWNQRAR